MPSQLGAALSVKLLELNPVALVVDDSPEHLNVRAADSLQQPQCSTERVPRLLMLFSGEKTAPSLNMWQDHEGLETLSLNSPEQSDLQNLDESGTCSP